MSYLESIFSLKDKTAIVIGELENSGSHGRRPCKNTAEVASLVARKQSSASN